jgi:hypothetical protein
VQRQLLRLLSALDRDGISVPDASSYRILQYNPPYTLPWLRRNELLVAVGGPLPGEGAMEGMGVSVSAGVTGWAEQEDEDEEGQQQVEEGEEDGSQPSDY